MPADFPAAWKYPLVGTTENKSTDRTGTPLGVSRELIGVDGSEEGGLRLFPGFLFCKELTLGYDGVGDTMDGFACLTWRLTATQYVHGFFYRAVNAAGTRCRYHLYMRLGPSTQWVTEVDYGFATGLLEEAYDGEELAVQAFGPYVYVGRKGLATFLFTLTATGTGGGAETCGVDPTDYELLVETETGPGKVPLFDNPAKNGFSVAIKEPGATEHQDMIDVLTVMTAPVTGEDAEARMIFCGFSGASHVSPDNINFVTNPYLPVRNVPVGYSKACNGPSMLKDASGNTYWATPPQANPGFINATFYDSTGAAIAPTYPVPPGGPQNEFYHLSYDEASRAASDPRGLASLQYVWAYQLFDSRTGRWSQLSQRIAAEPDAYGQSMKVLYGRTSDGKNTSSIQSVTFPMFDIIYDSLRFDTCLLYRGLTTSGISIDQVVLSLEKVITLDDFAIDTQPSSPWKRSAYFVTLSDQELAVQDTFLGSDTYLEAAPPAGALHLVEGTMLYGNTGQLDIEIGGLGVVRYSDLRKVSVELVPPLNRYPLKVPDEEVITFVDSGSNVVGFTRRSTYIFRRYNTDLQGFRLHKGYGATGQYAATDVASNGFFVTPKGLKFIDSAGNLKNVGALDYLIKNEWSGTLDTVHLAYDEELSCLCIHNPTLERTVFLWMETNKVTEIIDSNFKHVVEGDLIFEEECASPYLRRAVFVQEFISGGGVTAWRVFQIDHDRRKNNQRMLDPTGDVRVSANGLYGGGLTIDVTGSLGTRLEGCFLYVLEGDNAGAKEKIKSVSGNTITLYNSLPAPLANGTRLGISPVYFRWMGYMLPVIRQGIGVDPGERDLSRVRQMDQVGCVFTDVAGSASTDTTNNDARFAASGWRGNAESPVEVAVFPIDPAGKGVKYLSVYDGPSEITARLGADSSGNGHGITGSALFPAVEIYCPDLDFRLLEVNVTGTMLSTERQNRPITRRV